MKLPIYHIDSFASRIFEGNPASVVLVPSDASDLTTELMQKIAAENNTSATAFLTKDAAGGSVWGAVRWFTPAREIQLCGHATLASGLVLFEIESVGGEEVTLDSASGPLTISRKEHGRYTLDFPIREGKGGSEMPVEVSEGLRVDPKKCEFYISSEDCMVVVPSLEELTSMSPNYTKLGTSPYRGHLVTTKGGSTPTTDFTQRFFAPKFGITEDPVTGSAFTTSAPYWATKLGKDVLVGVQASSRPGQVTCTLHPPRVTLEGTVVLFMTGCIEV